MKKLLHPLIPLFILFILGGKYVYDAFWIDKYDEKQLVLLEQTRIDGENVSSLFSNIADKSVRSTKDCFAELNNPPSIIGVFEKIETLEIIYQKYLKQFSSNKKLNDIENKIASSSKTEKEKLYNQYFSIENLKIQTLFQEYIQEIRKADTLLAQKYQNYTFQNGESNEELTERYLNGKSIEVIIHINRIKAELAHIYSESTILLAEEYGYFKCADMFADNIVVPIIHKSKNGFASIGIVEIAPFMDSTRKNIATKEHFQTNVKYHIDEKGFFVIDEQDFDIKNLQLKWFPDINHNDNHKRIYLEYGKEGREYEK